MHNSKTYPKLASVVAEAVRAFMDYERFARRIAPGTERLYRFYLTKFVGFCAREERSGKIITVRTVDRYLQYFGRRGYGSGMRVSLVVRQIRRLRNNLKNIFLFD